MPQTIRHIRERVNPNRGTDLDREEKLQRAVSTSALHGAVQAIANDFGLSQSSIYHQADGRARSCWQDAVVWLDAAIRAKGHTPEGRREALAPLLLLVELYLSDDARIAVLEAEAVLGKMLAAAGNVTSTAAEAVADKRITPEEQREVFEKLLTLIAGANAVGAAFGLNLGERK